MLCQGPEFAPETVVAVLLSHHWGVIGGLRDQGVGLTNQTTVNYPPQGGGPPDPEGPNTAQLPIFYLTGGGLTRRHTTSTTEVHT